MSSTWDPDLTLPLAEPVEAADALVAHRYEIGELVGRGGSGQVHRAYDRRTQRHVAIKFVVRLGAAAERQVRRELTALRLLDLPGVVPLLDSGRDRDQVFLVMPLLGGGAFDALASPAGFSAWREEALAVLETLAGVHFAGVVHRDLKPNNILLGEAGRPFITDFGLAVGASVDRSTSGIIEGTPRYMAPEQRAGEPGDERSDLFALGVMFDEVLGEAPAPAHVRDLFAAMRAADPGDRPQSVLEVLDALGGAPDALLVGRAAALPDPAKLRDLRTLFAEGPHTFQHIATDAAALLHRRTSGRRDAVTAEIARWVRTGHCHWRGDVLHLTRPALDHLLREASGARSDLAAATRAGAPDARDAVLDHARDLHQRGASGLALAVASLIAATGEDAVSDTLVDIALSLQQPDHLDHARYLAQRFAWPRAHALLAAAHEGLFVDAGRGLETLAELSGLPPVLEGWRISLAVYLAVRLGGDSVQDWLHRADAWAADDPARLGRVYGLRARLAYARGDYADALALEQRGLDAATTPFQRLARATNAASAALGVPDLDVAETLATEALNLARELRHAPGEARATWLLRSILTRRRDPTPADPALVEAAAEVSPGIAAQLALVEAARAWRQGDRAVGRALASRSEAGFEAASFADGLALARALGMACGAPRSALDLSRCKPLVAAEAAALVHLAGHPAPDAPVPDIAGRMLNVLHGDEVLDALTGSRLRPP